MVQPDKLAVPRDLERPPLVRGLLVFCVRCSLGRPLCPRLPVDRL